MEALARQVVVFLDLRKRSIKLLESFCSSDKPPGMISTCSYCRKARDERGQWIYLDQFLSQRTNLNFSHGICDSCIEEHFLKSWKPGPPDSTPQSMIFTRLPKRSHWIM